MQVILKQDVQGLGYKNDQVKVKAGYGRNYLIPNGLALIANPSNKKLVEENVRQAAHKAAKLKQDAEALAAKIGELTMEMGTKAGESGKIFGAVTALQVADARGPAVNLTVAKFKHVNGRIVRQGRDGGTRPISSDKLGPSPLLAANPVEDLLHALSADTELLRDRGMSHAALVELDGRRLSLSLRFSHPATRS